MFVGESITVALFIWALVFAVLLALCVMVIVLTKVLGTNSSKKAAVANSAAPTQAVGADNAAEVVQASSGELRLKNVDEKTAAMIMAIVSDESKIPLSELRFKSISAVE